MRCLFKKRTPDLLRIPTALSFSLIVPDGVKIKTPPKKQGFPSNAGASQLSKGAAPLMSGATVAHCVATQPQKIHGQPSRKIYQSRGCEIAMLCSILSGAGERDRSSIALGDKEVTERSHAQKKKK